MTKVGKFCHFTLNVMKLSWSYSYTEWKCKKVNKGSRDQHPMLLKEYLYCLHIVTSGEGRAGADIGEGTRIPGQQAYAQD